MLFKAGAWCSISFSSPIFLSILFKEKEEGGKSLKKSWISLITCVLLLFDSLLFKFISSWFFFCEFGRLFVFNVVVANDDVIKFVFVLLAVSINFFINGIVLINRSSSAWRFKRWNMYV